MYDKDNPLRQPEHGTIEAPVEDALAVNHQFGVMDGRACGGCVTRECYRDPVQRCSLFERRYTHAEFTHHTVWVNEELYIKWKLLKS